jgi:hypothetical protein
MPRARQVVPDIDRLASRPVKWDETLSVDC